MSTWTQAPNYQFQINGHDLIGFNANTDRSSKLSIPNQWAQSHRLQCQHGHKLQTINSKPMGTISSASNSTRTQAPNYKCQTNVYNLIGFNVNIDTSSKLSMPNQCARSHRLQCQHGHKLQTLNVKPMGTIKYYEFI